jgi:hypothetical protein
MEVLIAESTRNSITGMPKLWHFRVCIQNFLNEVDWVMGYQASRPNDWTGSGALYKSPEWCYGPFGVPSRVEYQ